MNNKIIIVILVIVVAVASFYGGTMYSGSRRSNNFGSGGVNGGQFRQRFGGNGGSSNNIPVRGKVTSIDKNSMTIQMNDGSSKIVILSNDTRISQAQSAKISDIKNGNEVMAFGVSNSDGSVTAQDVQLNPANFRFGAGTGASPSPSGM
ncbi:DUF5666 domain-containing protein [Patescibacteria group bacterium]|nr:DUF5666 domain-containing protein [Patescibacteria group bacterium]